MRNTMVTYDRANSRVGFWKTNCSNLFETLTNLEGAQAPPLTPELVDEPPSDYVPGAEGQQQTPADVHPPAPVSQQSGTLLWSHGTGGVPSSYVAQLCLLRAWVRRVVQRQLHRMTCSIWS